MWRVGNPSQLTGRVETSGGGRLPMRATVGRKYIRASAVRLGLAAHFVLYYRQATGTGFLRLKEATSGPGPPQEDFVSLGEQGGAAGQPRRERAYPGQLPRAHAADVKPYPHSCARISACRRRARFGRATLAERGWQNEVGRTTEERHYRIEAASQTAPPQPGRACCCSGSPYAPAQQLRHRLAQHFRPAVSCSVFNTLADN